MKILSTVSCRSQANIFIELFHFPGLLMMWDLTISKSRGRYLQCCEVNGASKTRFTYPFTRAFTLPIEHAPAGEEVAHDRNAQLGRAQNTVLGWSDPTLGTFGCLKALWGRSRPHRHFTPKRVARRRDATTKICQTTCLTFCKSKKGESCCQ